jgi:hypothetical protein
MSRKYPKWTKHQIEKIATHLITRPDVDVMPIIKQACHIIEKYDKDHPILNML